MLDAGFKLHKQIGLHLRLAEVNGLPVSCLDYVVQNGDVLYVVATRNARPSPSWVTAAHCRTTRGKIQHLRSKEPGEYIYIYKYIYIYFVHSSLISTQHTHTHIHTQNRGGGDGGEEVGGGYIREEPWVAGVQVGCGADGGGFGEGGAVAYGVCEFAGLFVFFVVWVGGLVGV